MSYSDDPENMHTPYSMMNLCDYDLLSPVILTILYTDTHQI